MLERLPVDSGLKSPLKLAQLVGEVVGCRRIACKHRLFACRIAVAQISVVDHSVKLALDKV